MATEIFGKPKKDVRAYQKYHKELMHEHLKEIYKEGLLPSDTKSENSDTISSETMHPTSFQGMNRKLRTVRMAMVAGDKIIHKWHNRD